jgi:hypothetical protein
MANEASSLKKAAVLTGLTMVMGGAEISEVNAATTTVDGVLANPVQLSLTSGTTQSTTGTVTFNQFNNVSGPFAGATLTDVQFTLNSNISSNDNLAIFSLSADVTVDTPAVQIGPATTVFGSYAFTLQEGLLNPPAAGFYEGLSTFAVTLNLSAAGESGNTVTWDPPPPFMTVTYTYTVPTSATPLPAALPLFTTGLAGLGFTTWLGRRKQKAKTKS